MTDKLTVDIETFRTKAKRFNQLASQLGSAEALLADGLGREGECWGHDDIGASFLEGYSPRARTAFDNASHHREHLTQIGDTLQEAADKYDTTPDAIFTVITAAESAAPRRGERGEHGMGFGRMTLQEVCDNNDVPVANALTALTERGIDAQPTDTMRDIADRLGVMPVQVFPLLTEERPKSGLTENTAQP